MFHSFIMSSFPLNCWDGMDGCLIFCFYHLSRSYQDVSILLREESPWSPVGYSWLVGYFDSRLFNFSDLSHSGPDIKGLYLMLSQSNNLGWVFDNLAFNRLGLCQTLTVEIVKWTKYTYEASNPVLINRAARQVNFHSRHNPMRHKCGP